MSQKRRLRKSASAGPVQITPIPESAPDLGADITIIDDSSLPAQSTRQIPSRPSTHPGDSQIHHQQPRKNLTFINQTVETLHHYITSKSRPKRSKLTQTEIQELNEWFSQQPSVQLTPSIKREWALRMGVNIRVIQEWHNERRRQSKSLLAAMKQPMYSGAPIQIKMMSKRSQKQRGRSRSESMPLPGPSCNSVTPPQTPLPAPLSMDDDIQQICGVQQPSFSTNIFANSTASEMAAVNFQDPFSYQRLAPPSPLGWPHSQQQQSNDLAAITNANDMNFSRSQQLTMLQSSDNPSSTLFNYYQPPRPRRHTTSSPSSNSGFMATEGADLWHQSFNQFTSYRVPDYDPLLSDGVNCAANDFYNPTPFANESSCDLDEYLQLQQPFTSADYRRRSFSDTAAFGGHRHSPTAAVFTHARLSPIDDGVQRDNSLFNYQQSVDGQTAIGGGDNIFVEFPGHNVA